MAINDKFFPSQEKTERVFLLIRKHWFVYVIFVFVTILMLIPVSILVPYLMTNLTAFTSLQLAEYTSGISIYLLSILALLIYGFVNYYLDVYIVTNKRIVDISQNGFFNREISELHLHQVQDVSAHVHGVFKTVLHFGDVHIQTAGERENFVFMDIPHPYTVAKEIIELHEDQIEGDNRQTKQLPSEPISLDNNEPEKGFWLEKIEREAKKILKETPVLKRIETGGVFPAKHLHKKFKLDTGRQLYKPHECHDEINSKTEGELCEGKDVKLN